MSRRFPQPLFILGAPRSYTSLACGMIGQHPRTYGVPELNLFVAETIADLWQDMSGLRQIQLHGLLRVVAEVYAGEQTINALDMARRWILRRMNQSTADIYRELCQRVAPLRIVDKSPAYVSDPRYLERIAAAFPHARYLHLIRHPRTQGESIMKLSNGMFAVMTNSVDYSTEPPTVDPQIMWYRVQCTIVDFLAAIPSGRRRRLRAEDLMNDTDAQLKRLCKWLGLPSDRRSIAAMRHPEHSAYACLGPVGAHLGNDINFLTSPRFRGGRVARSDLEAPLSWRPDGRCFRPEVVGMARMLGYR